MSGHDEKMNEAWETGKLGRDIAHARRAPAELEAEVERALAMKLVSIRLPIPMIDALKAIAKYHQIGYQPMIRDLLSRFVASEIPTILERLRSEAESVAEERTAPVDSFLGQKKAACG